MHINLVKSAARQLSKLDKTTQRRIIEKLEFYLVQGNPLQFAEKLKDFRFGSWRYRMGNYRVIFDIIGNKINILKIGHRKDVYK